MDISLERSKIKIVVENHCSVGFMVKTIARRIVHCIGVEDLRLTMLRRCR